MPLFYDAELRKNIESLLSLYKDLIVYVIFYLLVIFGFALIANNFVQMDEEEEYDEYIENYGSLGRTLFTFYVLSTYDSFPENQEPAIKSDTRIICLFVVFIFLNFIIFSTVPTSFLWKSFKENHARRILLSEIRQQHSLLLAFVALSDKDLRLSEQKLLSFLFEVYHRRTKYVGYITKICLQLHQNNNEYIEISEFMQICKILQSDSTMLPSKSKPSETWESIRSSINSSINIKFLVRNEKFPIFIAILVTLSIANCLLVLYSEIKIFESIDKLFTIIFCFEMLIKIFAYDFEDFFKGTLNKFDFFIIFSMAIFELYKPNIIFNEFDSILKLLRFYRVPLIGKLVEKNKNFREKHSFYVKTARLISQIIIIFPIVLKFFSVFAVISYSIGVLGMIIYDKEPELAPLESPYSLYESLANFEGFLQSQFVVVQILIEAGWSIIALDHAHRYSNFIVAVLYFVVCHLTVVFVLVSIIKGMVWEVYETVHKDLNKRTENEIKKESLICELNRQKEELIEIEMKILKVEQFSKNLTFQKPERFCQTYNFNFSSERNLLTRIVIENKIDMLIWEEMKTKNEMKMKRNFSQKYEKNNISQKYHPYIKENLFQPEEKQLNSLHLLVDEFDEFEESESEYNDQENYLITKMLNNEDIWEIEDLQKEDIENQISKLSERIKIDEKSFLFWSWHPKILSKFLQLKLTQISEDSEVDILLGSCDILSGDFTRRIKSEINTILGIKNTKNKEFLNSLDSVLREYGLELDKDLFLSKQKQRSFSVDSSWVLRKAFLSDLTEKQISSLEFSYFSQIYGNEIGQLMDNVSIENLLAQQNPLTHALHLLLMNPGPGFFALISKIETQLTSLLRRGSLFKFVYQVQTNSEQKSNENDSNWFTVEVTPSKNIKVHFIKNGIWAWDPGFRANRVYVGNDFFCGKGCFEKEDTSLGKKILRMLFQSFETMALSLENKENFFKFEPSERIYNLFLTYVDINKGLNFSRKNFSISKIMCIALENEGERSELLDYELSSMDTIFEKNDIQFSFDDSQREMLKKFRKMESTNYNINQTQGLPYIFVANLMTEIRDIMKMYSNNFASQVEKLLHRNLNNFEDKQTKQNSNN